MWMVGFLILILCGVICLWILNLLYKRSNHFKNGLKRVEHLKNVPDQLDVVNLGSSYSYFAYDWEIISKKRGYNLAVYPQYLGGDLQVLNNFADRMNKGAKILLNVSCFVFGTAYGTNRTAQDRLYYVLKKENIYKYSRWTMFAHIYFPLIGNYKLLKYIIKDVLPETDDGIMQDPDKMCRERVLSVCRQFGLNDLQDTEQLKSLEGSFKECQKVLASLVALCRKHHFVPVVVIPPVHRTLVNAMSESFFHACIIENIKSAGKDIQIMNYWAEMQEDEYYFDPLWLNKAGRKKFTNRILRDLEMLYGQ